MPSFDWLIKFLEIVDQLSFKVYISLSVALISTLLFFTDNSLINTVHLATYYLIFILPFLSFSVSMSILKLLESILKGLLTYTAWQKNRMAMKTRLYNLAPFEKALLFNIYQEGDRFPELNHSTGGQYIKNLISYKILMPYSKNTFINSHKYAVPYWIWKYLKRKHKKIFNDFLPITSHCKTINGQKVYYRTAGKESNRCLIFLQAWGVKLGDKDSYFAIRKDELIKSLACDFYVIDIEPPGLVRSETPISDWSYEHSVETIKALIDKLGLKSFFLCGSSYGGGIATKYSVTYPDDVKVLLLCDSVISNAYPKTNFVEGKRMIYARILKSRIVPNQFKKFVIWVYMGSPLDCISNEEIKRKADMCSSFERLSLDVDYSSLPMPVLLVWGKRDLHIHPIQYAQQIESLISKCKLIEVDGSVERIYKRPIELLKIIRNEVAFINS